ncbi:uncharacterized protein LOC123536798 [Mercenaria mercenaria]|uniref:uncharacterized protein LOC123536798 n=1 Tax=Mercenaria mercenaria TaxID=6596 RepID=UPI00234F17AA|nr:uncharacterized protein LOC123536798 [Mercenaria mercenaria]XP_045176176.2 uncharacterized protein LOC123536798 [Mercenaria mercenaria]
MALEVGSAQVGRNKPSKQVVFRVFSCTKYMQKPPLIMPNYGKKSPKLGVPKTSLSRVLLYDNITQQQMLDVKLANIKIEKQRAEYLMGMHRRSFSKGLANKRRRQRECTLKEMNQAHLPEIDLNKKRMSSVPMTPLLRKFSTFSLDDVKLPNIGDHKKQIMLKLKTKSGRQKIYHSYDESGIFVDFVPIHALYDNVRDDPRFQNLQTALMPPDDENVEGFVILSPSYEKHYPKIPEYLQKKSENEMENCKR